MTTSPRFKNCPPICASANLPAFQSLDELDAFTERNCPRTIIIARWRCNACSLIHSWGMFAGPSGESSGTTRMAKHLADVKQRFRASAVARTVGAWI